MAVDRIFIKAKMILDRGDTCELCKYLGRENPGHADDMHELVPRSKTINNEEARELSFQPELCVLLCSDCHFNNIKGEYEAILWGLNIARYGERGVQAALDRLQEVIPTFDVSLP